MPATANHRLRALMFTAGLLLGVAATGQFFVTDRGRAAVGASVAPPGWTLNFCAPAGLRDVRVMTDLLGTQRYVYTDKIGQRILCIRRLTVSPDSTPESLGRSALKQIELETALRVSTDVPNRPTTLGDWPARIFELSLQDIPGAAAIQVNVLATVADHGEGRREAYTLELISGRAAAERHEQIWRAVLESITFREGKP